MNVHKGFTLIELLVVIAIIGLLASVILAALSTARTNAVDASVRADLQSLHSQAEIFASDNSGTYAAGTYIMSAGATCPNAPVSNTPTKYRLTGDSQFFTNMATANAQGGYCAHVITANMWAVAVQLKGLNTAWCVDSFGNSKLISDVVNFTQATLNARATTFIPSGCI